MPVTCICLGLPENDPRATALMKKNGITHGSEDLQKEKTNLDLCKIWNRTQDKTNKHNDYDCHLKGERRQNLINKLKMFLDNADDRPVMKSRSGKKDAGTSKGQTGFGPMIKYPGYVDYDHPYFSDPYNKMPQLAMTSGYQQRSNPCPPISVTVPSIKSERGSKGQNQSNGQRVLRSSEPKSSGEHCQCGKVSEEMNIHPTSKHDDPPFPKQEQGNQKLEKEMDSQQICRDNPVTLTTAQNGCARYCCYPIPN